MSTASVSRTKAWMMAARPQTLPAAAAPIIVGTGLAVHEGVFAPTPALMAFVGAALIQIGTNFANDYYDAKKGADTDDREGFTRVTQTGLIEPQQVKFATVVTFGLAILVGTYLVYVGGLAILFVGLVSVLCGWAYTGGPYPLGYHGLGDLFVFVFFGIVAVMGTFYVQAAAVSPIGPLATTIPEGAVTTTAFLTSLPVAAIATMILVVNNVRDMETDREAGKRTLAVRLGYRWSRIQFVALLGLAYVIPVALWLGGFDLAVLLPLVTIPYAAMIARTLWTRTDGEALNPALENTGKLHVLFAVLFATGLVFG